MKYKSISLYNTEINKWVKKEKLFLTGECQLINVGKNLEKEKHYVAIIIVVADKSNSCRERFDEEEDRV